MEEFGGKKIPTTYDSEPWVILKNLVNSNKLKKEDRACVQGMACPEFPEPEKPENEEKETKKTKKKKEKCSKACGTGCTEEKAEDDAPPEVTYFCDQCLMGPENRELFEAFTLTKTYAILCM